MRGGSSQPTAWVPAGRPSAPARPSRTSPSSAAARRPAARGCRCASCADTVATARCAGGAARPPGRSRGRAPARRQPRRSAAPGKEPAPPGPLWAAGPPSRPQPCVLSTFPSARASDAASPRRAGRRDFDVIYRLPRPAACARLASRGQPLPRASRAQGTYGACAKAPPPPACFPATEGALLQRASPGLN